MDGCWQPWLLGCVIDWEAWAAIGTFLAVAYAILTSIQTEKRRVKESADLNRTFVGQLHSELLRIHRISSWWIQLKKSFDRGEIPHGFEPAIALAISDARKIDTPTYDAFRHLMPSIDPRTARFLIPAFTSVTAVITFIRTEQERSGLPASQEVFDRLKDEICSLQTALHVALLHTSAYIGADPKEAMTAGPARYLDSAWWPAD